VGAFCFFSCPGAREEIAECLVFYANLQKELIGDRFLLVHYKLLLQICIENETLSNLFPCAWAAEETEGSHLLYAISMQTSDNVEGMVKAMTYKVDEDNRKVNKDQTIDLKGEIRAEGRAIKAEAKEQSKAFIKIETLLKSKLKSDTLASEKGENVNVKAEVEAAIKSEIKTFTEQVDKIKTAVSDQNVAIEAKIEAMNTAAKEQNVAIKAEIEAMNTAVKEQNAAIEARIIEAINSSLKEILNKTTNE
jgi:hypothetical protein